ncbi:MAG: RHS repeat-associated core domain-containing protein [Acidobacteria bacterium]|nr:RHS repeat-associated core domain-containing protein [Acidobacteriota bacterium]
MSAAGRMLGRRHAGGGWARGVRLLLAALLLVVGAQRASAQTEVVEYYGQDALGSVRIVFDASGAAVARADYEPFGELFTVPGMPGTSELPATQFTGQERDAEASLDYFGARFFVPRTGRFSQVDPVYAGLFDPQQWNRYAYARNNPLTFVDPTGRQLYTGIPGFCSAENSYIKCGGDDFFWNNLGGGGVGGISFGDGYARATSIGWTPGMSSDLAEALFTFEEQSTTAMNTSVLKALVSVNETPTIGTLLSPRDQLDMKAVTLGELAAGSAEQIAAALSTMINRAWLTGAPIQAVLNSDDYQAVGNTPYTAVQKNTLSSMQSAKLEAAFSMILNGPTTNATHFITGSTSAATNLGHVLPASPAELVSPNVTMHLYVVAPGYNVVIAGWKPR